MLYDVAVELQLDRRGLSFAKSSPVDLKVDRYATVGYILNWSSNVASTGSLTPTKPVLLLLSHIAYGYAS